MSRHGHVPNQYDTLAEALQAARQRHYLIPFSYRDGRLFNDLTGEVFRAGDVFVDEFHRMEGDSNPSDSAIVYFLQTRNGQKGWLVDAYGAAGNGELADLLSAKSISNSNPANTTARCANCQSPLQGPYCSQCGQKAVDLNTPFWKLMVHLVADLFHADSLAWRTLRALLFRPGFLTTEYLGGRRVRYVHPIRLYLFVSAVYFLFYFALPQQQDDLTVRLNLSSAPEQTAGNDSAIHERFSSLPDTQDTSHPTASAFGRRLEQNIESFSKKLQENPKEVSAEFLNRYKHQFPKAMFLLLPLFALLHNLIYFRPCFPLTHSFIFSLHVHSFAFVFLFLTLLMNRLSGWSVPAMVTVGVFAAYLIAALQRIHQQTWGITVLKALLLFAAYGILLLATSLLLAFLVILTYE